MRKKPYKRMSVPMTENGYKAIEKLAQASGSSLGSAVETWLEESHTTILKLADAIEAAKSDPATAHRMMQRMALEAQKELSEEQLDMLDRAGN